jgi:DNA-binding NtrC family response regulator
VRQVNWYVYPDANFDLASPTGTIAASPTPYNFHYAPAANEARAEGEFIIGNNLKMKEISGLISKVAPTPTTVLIRGESGTGKELVARAVLARLLG